MNAVGAEGVLTGKHARLLEEAAAQRTRDQVLDQRTVEQRHRIHLFRAPAKTQKIEDVFPLKYNLAMTSKLKSLNKQGRSHDSKNPIFRLYAKQQVLMVKSVLFSFNICGTC